MGSRTSEDRRESLLGGTAGVALVLGVAAIILAAMPGLGAIAVVTATLAIVLAAVVIGLHARRQLYATGGLLLGWFAFAYSVAMTLWG